jgi:methyltransferase (TIGR00027 family)
MIEAVPSRTAEMVALLRAVHQVIDVPPVFVDPLALRVAGVASAHIETRRSIITGGGRNVLRAFVAVRSRFADERAAQSFARGVRQVVILGAGLDTFAYRHPHGPALRVFEVDFPSTQQWKRERVRDAGIDVPESLAYVSVDFEREDTFDRLAASGFDRTQPAMFSWLGVTMYLEEAVVMAVLRAVSRLPAGSGIVFDYFADAEGLPPRSRMAVEAMGQTAAAVGEPWKSMLDPEPFAEAVKALGFSVPDHLDGPAINARYFNGRTDGLRVGSAGRLMYARL